MILATIYAIVIVNRVSASFDAWATAWLAVKDGFDVHREG